MFDFGRKHQGGIFMKKTAAFLSALAIMLGAAGVMPAPELMTLYAEESSHNSQETAAELTAGTAFSDSLISKDEANWYKLTTTEDGCFTLTFEHDKLGKDNTYWTITAYQSNGGKLKVFRSWNVAGNVEKTTTDALGVPAGEYYIEIAYGGTYHSDSTYSLTANFSAGGWETEFNDSLEDADELELNQTYNGLLHNAEDEDWYRFSTEEASSFSLNFVHDKLDSSNNHWTITVYQETNGKLKVFRSWNVAGNTEKFTTDTLGVPAGTYCVQIAFGGYYYSTTPYALTVNYSANGNETKNDWESEFNDSYEDADEIKVNQPYSGLLHTSDDVDWYKFTTDADGKFSLRFLHDKIDSSSTYWQFTIYQFDNGKLKKFGTWSVDGNEEKYDTCGLGVPAGEYYLEVFYGGYYYSTTPYELIVNFTANADNPDGAWETEFNDYKEDADPISQNQSYNGTILNSEDTDWYKFTVAAAGNVTLRFEHPKLDGSSNFWTMNLYQGNNKVTTLNIKGNETLTMAEDVEVEAGEYYVEILYGGYFSSAATYTFRVNNADAPSTPDTPGTTTPPDQPSGGLYGDHNNDGDVNSADAALILMYSAESGAGLTTLSFYDWIQANVQ